MGKSIKKKMFPILKKMMRFIFYKVVFPFLYQIYAIKPVQNNKVIFVEDKHPYLTNSFELLFCTLDSNYYFEVRSYFLKRTTVSKKEYILTSLKLVKDVATAKYVFLNDGSYIISCLNLRAKTKSIQLWHGCGAFKKFGFSTAELIFGTSREDMLRYPAYNKLSLVSVSSPEVIWAYEEAMGIDPKINVVRALGVSRTDVFFDEKFKRKAFEQVYQVFPNAKGKKIILYAPTFRGRVANGTLEDRFDIELFQEQLSENYVLINKYHPLIRERPKISKGCECFAKDLTDTMSIEALLCVSDICISDYSSLIYEYSLFEKPMIFFAYDLDEFHDWRGFYYNYDELTPGPIYNNNIDMINYIKSIEKDFDSTEVKAFKERFMSACDGHSTERIMQYVFGNDLIRYRK